jgi:chemotaxis protein MotB
MEIYKAHGGAWKVAYADFVTAMMALFMVLWICAQDKEILLATSKYFQSPFNSPLQETYGVMQDGAPSMSHESGDGRSIIDMAFLHKVAEEFMRLLNIDEAVSDKPVDVVVTTDGLRITLYNQSKQPLFKMYSSELTDWGDLTMQNLSWMMDRYDMRIRVDAYASALKEADALPFDTYDPFDMTALRANVVQKSLRKYGLSRPIERVTGFGDTRFLDNTLPFSPRNERIELSLVVN